MSEDYRVERLSGPLPSAVEMRASLEAEGYSHVYEWSDAPGSTYPAHQHDTDQSHCVISGELELTVEDVGRFVLHAGDRDFMPAGTRHSARVIGEEPVRYLIAER